MVSSSALGGGASQPVRLGADDSDADKPPPYHTLVAADSASSAANPAAVSSVLQPRVAVILNVPRSWHRWLFAARLLSIGPALAWGLPLVLRLLTRLVVLLVVVAGEAQVDGDGLALTIRVPLRLGGEGAGRVPLTETSLAVIWCFASGYLSFFFADCLMSRWLLRYTPQATIVRLLSISAVNAFATSHVLGFFGGFDDTRLLLPGWIGIATALTFCYHITQRKISIRKETSTSINVFSLASFLSMVALLAHIHLNEHGYPEMPFVAFTRKLWEASLERVETPQVA